MKLVNDLLICYSGGSDSRLLLQFARSCNYSPLCLLIDYNQLHKEELKKASELLTSKNIGYLFFKLPDYKVNSALTTGEKAIYNNISEYYVPNRNNIILSVAVGIAESRNINLIWYGADYSDRLNIFPDCYQEYVVEFNNLLKKSISKNIQVEAPLLGMTKDMILKLLKYHNISEEEYFSGYGQFS